MLLRRRPYTSIGRGPLLRKRCAYNQIPEPKFKTRVMTTTEMAITRLAATAVSQRPNFQVAFSSITVCSPHLELTYVTQRRNPCASRVGSLISGRSSHEWPLTNCSLGPQRHQQS